MFPAGMRKNLRRMIVRLAQGCECGAVTEDEQSIAVEYVGSSWQQVVNCAGVLLQGVFLRLLPAQCGVGVADEAANIMDDRLQPPLLPYRIGLQRSYRQESFPPDER